MGSNWTRRRSRAGWPWLTLVSLACLSALAPRAPGAQARKIEPIYHNARAFKVPFVTNASIRNTLKEVRLYYSDDLGVTWKPAGKALPSDLSVTFRAPEDGEYWFAAVSIDLKGRMSPKSDAEVEPSMKVIVDTKPPTASLEPLPRRGATASVRWEVRDERLDLSSLSIEYQALGARDWRQVPIRKPALIGMETWNASTAEPVKVRLTVWDFAGNKKVETITLGDGTPRNPALSGPSDIPDASEPPPLGAFASKEAERQVSDTGPPAMPNLANDPPSFEEPPRLNPSPRNAAPAMPNLPDAPQAQAPVPPPQSAPPQNTQPAPAQNPAPAPAPAPAQPQPGKPELIASPKFSLKYAVDDAGPNGPATVQLWVTQNGGQTWSQKAEDTDRQSPFDIDLGGEGTYGIRLVARSSSGQGDTPPAPGDQPHMLLEVDSTPPVVRLDPVKVENAPDGVKLTITWHATDVHLGPRCVMLTWRADEPGARWTTIAAGLDNTGQYLWNVPPQIPTKFHVRVDVMDSLGHRGWAESTENGPINIDRTRPKSRIIGLEPIGGRGPSARPIR